MTPTLKFRSSRRAFSAFSCSSVELVRMSSSSFSRSVSCSIFSITATSFAADSTISFEVPVRWIARWRIEAFRASEKSPSAPNRSACSTSRSCASTSAAAIAYCTPSRISGAFSRLSFSWMISASLSIAACFKSTSSCRRLTTMDSVSALSAFPSSSSSLLNPAIRLSELLLTSCSSLYASSIFINASWAWREASCSRSFSCS
mmetsp:Transcript_31393/g.74411  ORF Transcript_31393/g.74411 Transcript_31393/m.74411 type:complete len:203 (-) Transcript_31393:423-1031(-)